MIIVPIFQMTNRGTERSSNLLKVTQLVSGSPGMKCPSFPVVPGKGEAFLTEDIVPSRNATQLLLTAVKEDCGSIVARSSDFLKETP